MVSSSEQFLTKLVESIQLYLEKQNYQGILKDEVIRADGRVEYNQTLNAVCQHVENYHTEFDQFFRKQFDGCASKWPYSIDREDKRKELSLDVFFQFIRYSQDIQERGVPYDWWIKRKISQTAINYAKSAEFRWTDTFSPFSQLGDEDQYHQLSETPPEIQANSDETEHLSKDVQAYLNTFLELLSQLADEERFLLKMKAQRSYQLQRVDSGAPQGRRQKHYSLDDPARKSYAEIAKMVRKRPKLFLLFHQIYKLAKRIWNRWKVEDADLYEKTRFCVDKEYFPEYYFRNILQSFQLTNEQQTSVLEVSHLKDKDEEPLGLTGAQLRTLAERKLRDIKSSFDMYHPETDLDVKDLLAVLSDEEVLEDESHTRR